MARYVLWQSSDIKDYKKFPKEDIHTDQPYLFSKMDAKPVTQEVLYHWDLPRKNIETLLQDNETTAFIVIRNDSILYENYFNGYERSSINTSFSVAKSITSLLVGIAIDDGFIKSSSDPITNYLPELKQRDARFEKITIDHLLDMKSGIKFIDSDLPWGDRVKAYYSPRLRKKLLYLTIESDPGVTYEYNTYHPQLLGLILERTTGKSPARYLEEKIWKPLGMEFDASWSLDSKRDKMVKMESGINCRAIDVAKIGKIILEKGKYNNKRIVSEAWIEKLTDYNDTNRFPRNNLIHYQSAWWTLEPYRGYRHAVYADGHLGQFLFIFPEDNTIIVRMGKKMGKDTESVLNWLVIGSDIIKHLNK
ncbi:MAG: serine hydrolase [Saprospiraceae bacterium]|nr:serine hydrolase [Saprospiraceae bacterium]